MPTLSGFEHSQCVKVHREIRTRIRHEEIVIRPRRMKGLKQRAGGRRLGALTQRFRGGEAGVTEVDLGGGRVHGEAGARSQCHR